MCRLDCCRLCDGRCPHHRLQWTCRRVKALINGVVNEGKMRDMGIAGMPGTSSLNLTGGSLASSGIPSTGGSNASAAAVGSRSAVRSHT